MELEASTTNESIVKVSNWPLRDVVWDEVVRLPISIAVALFTLKFSANLLLNMLQTQLTTQQS